MILTGEKRSTVRKISLGATFSTTNLKRTGPESNPPNRKRPSPHSWNFEVSLLWSKESTTGTYQSQKKIQPTPYNFIILLLILFFPISLEISETSIAISFPYFKYELILIDPMCAT